MISIKASSVIDASVSKVWPLLRDFGAIERWLPGVARSEIENGGGGTTVGAVRLLTMENGSRMREQLTGLSDANHTISFDIIDPAFPVRDYSAAIRLEQITSGDRCFIIWCADFEADEADIASMRAQMVDDVFKPGFEGLAEALSSG